MPSLPHSLATTHRLCPTAPDAGVSHTSCSTWPPRPTAHSSHTACSNLPKPGHQSAGTCTLCPAEIFTPAEMLASDTASLQQAKLVLLGDMGAGKSSLVLRFVKGQFFDYQVSRPYPAYERLSACSQASSRLHSRLGPQRTRGHRPRAGTGPRFRRVQQAETVLVVCRSPP